MAKIIKSKKSSKTETDTKKKVKSKTVELPTKKKSKTVELPTKKKKAKAADETSPKSKKGDKKGSVKPAKEKRVKRIIQNDASPVKTRMNRGQLLAAVIEEADLQSLFGKKFELSERLERKIVQQVLQAQESLILGSIHKNGIGQFTLGNLLKIVTKKIDAKPRRKGINPFTKEEQWFEAKPATVRVKVRPMKRLKDAAL